MHVELDLDGPIVLLNKEKNSDIIAAQGDKYNIKSMLLLLSPFSCVRLCATP